MASATQIIYLECTIPSGVTIAEYRRSRPSKRSRLTTLGSFLKNASVIRKRPQQRRPPC